MSRRLMVALALLLAFTAVGAVPGRGGSRGDPVVGVGQ